MSENNNGGVGPLVVLWGSCWAIAAATAYIVATYVTKPNPKLEALKAIGEGLAKGLHSTQEKKEEPPAPPPPPPTT